MRINEGMTSRPEVRKIDGRNCLVIPIEGGMLINGIAVKPDAAGNAGTGGD